MDKKLKKFPEQAHRLLALLVTKNTIMDKLLTQGEMLPEPVLNSLISANNSIRKEIDAKVKEIN